MKNHLFLPCLLLIFLFIQPAANAAVKKRYSPCKIQHPSDALVEWGCYRLKGKETLENLFGDSWQDVARFNRIDRRHAWPGMTLKVPRQLEDIKDFSPLPSVFPAAENDEKFILVNLMEQFLGAYEQGRLVFSFPIASGDSKFITPAGEFQVTAFSRNHASSLYKIEKTRIPYPMHYALRFFINEKELPSGFMAATFPAIPLPTAAWGSTMRRCRRNISGTPVKPELSAARTLYEWAIGTNPDDGGLTRLKSGPRVLIIGEPPI